METTNQLPVSSLEHSVDILYGKYFIIFISARSVTAPTLMEMGYLTALTPQTGTLNRYLMESTGITEIFSLFMKINN